MICHYCDQIVPEQELVTTNSYWTGARFFSHAGCKQSGFEAEVIECQSIDADCNDCGHFKRDRIVGKEVWAGFCSRFEKPTLAYPKKWTGRPCFEHRKALVKAACGTAGAPAGEVAK